MTFLVHTKAFPHLGSAQMCVFRAKVLPFLLPCGLNHQCWLPDPGTEHITLMLQTQVSNFKTPIPTCVPWRRKSTHTDLPLYSRHHTHIIVLTSLYIFFIICLILYLTIWDSEKLPTQLTSTWAGIWVRSARSQAPCFFLLPTRHSTLPFPTCFGLAKKVLFCVIYGWRKEKQPKGNFQVSLTLSRIQFQERVLFSETV